jgi:hypothetical protein
MSYRDNCPCTCKLDLEHLEADISIIPEPKIRAALESVFRPSLGSRFIQWKNAASRDFDLGHSPLRRNIWTKAGAYRRGRSLIFFSGVEDFVSGCAWVLLGV